MSLTIQAFAANKTRLLLKKYFVFFVSSLCSSWSKKNGQLNAGRLLILSIHLMDNHS
jgi:hypothetical protein